MNSMLTLLAQRTPEALEEAAAGHRSMALLMFACALVSLVGVVVTVICRQRRREAPPTGPGQQMTACRLAPAPPVAAQQPRSREHGGPCRLETCPSCGYRVVAKADGRCPSCQSPMAVERST